MKIWDLPKTEKEAIIFFQNKGLLPTTKQCVTQVPIPKMNMWSKIQQCFSNMYIEKILILKQIVIDVTLIPRWKCRSLLWRKTF